MSNLIRLIGRRLVALPVMVLGVTQEFLATLGKVTQT